MNAQRKISTGSMYEDNSRKTSTAVMFDATTTNCSHESLVFSMERFFKSVNTMNAIVMVPSRLVDIEDDDSDEDVSSAASTCSENSATESNPQRNLFHAYKMLVDAKEDLIWQREDADENNVELPQAKQFKYHLEQLNHLLTEFSDLAEHLTKKYQNAPGIKEEECSLIM